MVNRLSGFLSLRPALALALGIVAGCATPPSASDFDATVEYQHANDPAEPANRNIFEGNRAVDRVLLKPAAEGYHVLPQPMRDGVHSFLTNWQELLVFVHDLLQGELACAGETLIRFLTNTTIGFLGVGDVASEGLGLYHHDEDMGQTLAAWGINEGPYVMLPLLGPSNARDTVGRVVDFFIDPIGFTMPLPLAATVGKMAMGGVDQRERHLEALDDVERTSIDFYASIRTLYRQRRAEEIRNGAMLQENGMIYEVEYPRTLGMSLP